MKNLKLYTEMLWVKYNECVCKIPQIQSIKLIKNKNIWAQFLADDLYNKRYILYLDEDLSKQQDEFIEQIVFHELTHLSDSLKFLKHNKKDFVSLMNIYSEIHASEIQMDRMLITQNTSNYSLDRNIIHNKITTLKAFMERALMHLNNEFHITNDIYFTASNIKFDLKEFYYFVGYLTSINRHGISFEYNLLGVHTIFRNKFKEIINNFSNGQYDEGALLKYENELENLILNAIDLTNKGVLDSLFLDLDKIVQDLGGNFSV